MPSVIYKYPFQVEGEVEIEMPKGARVLCVQVQRDIPCIWAIIEPSQPIVEIRHFRVFGTGQPMDMHPDFLHYIGTFQLAGGNFIGHLFEPVLK